MKFGPLLALLAGISLASSTVALAQDTDTDDTPHSTCISVHAIDTYQPIDRNHIVIVGRGDRTLLLGTFHPGCWDIMRARLIALQTQSSPICAGQTAVLMVSGDRCYIRSLEAVDSVDAARALVEERSE